MSLPDLRAYADHFAKCGYDEELLSAVGEPLQSGFMKRSRVEWPEETSESARTLLSLFALFLPQSEAALQQALAPLSLDPLLEAGLVQRDGDHVLALRSIVPFHGRWVVCDPFPFAEQPIPTDYVLPPSNGTRIAAWTTVFRSGGVAWDLGTGQGAQAVQLAAEGMQVIASDITDRALQSAKLTASLNGQPQIEWRQGSFLEPFGDETADVIVSNPPFVITTGQGIPGLSAQSGADSGSDSGPDSAVEQLARELPLRLRPGGWMTMLASWYQDDEKDWTARPRAWLKDSGCNCWIVLLSQTEPARFAEEMRSLPGNGDFDPVAWAQLIRELKMKQICYGLILCQKAEGPGWFRCEAIPALTLRQAHQGQIERVFANTQQMYSGLSAQQSLKRHFRRVEDIQILRKGPQAQIQHQNGFALPINCSPGLAEAILKWSPDKWPAEILGPFIPSQDEQKALMGLLFRNGYLELV
ncbi:MAG TPA: methyltransferase [Fimbriimonadaceae bacterium]|nr:methyltransferase [Fimbriimonadaceae bacterium]HRJ32386.1 methyltransferase [Fimbriimonadaceae bacterium]